MKTFREHLLNEGKAPIKRADFIKTIEGLFLKHFPNGNFRSSGGCLGGDDSIHFSATLYGGDNVTRLNDPMQISAWVHDAIDEDGNLKSKVCLEWSQSSLSTNPAPDSFMAMDTVRFKFRKKTGTPEALLKAIGTSFKKAAGLVLDNVDNIYRVHTIDKKYLKINR